MKMKTLKHKQYQESRFLQVAFQRIHLDKKDVKLQFNI